MTLSITKLYRYAERRDAVCRILFNVTLSVIMMNVVMLSAVMLSWIKILKFLVNKLCFGKCGLCYKTVFFG